LKITPLDLRNQEFGRTLRGYDPEEVRVFLELVSDEFEILIKENSRLSEHVRELDEKIRDYRNMEKTLNATLIAAQKSAESYSENARKEADLILENAQVESRKTLEEVRREKTALEEEIIRLQRIRRTHVKKLKSFLEEQLELISGQEDSSVIISENPGRAHDGDRDDDTDGPLPEEPFHPTFSVDDEAADNRV
jgi:cell division initiation protein